MFRIPKYVERYEDTVYDLETPINVPAGGALQKKDGYRIVADNSNEIAPFDWYSARLEVDFVVQLLNGTAIAVDDHNGIVNGSHSLIKSIVVLVNGIQVYDNTEADLTVNIRNLVEYSIPFAKTTGTNQFFYLDTSRGAEERPAEDAYNKGFASRKALLGTSSTVNTEIPLKVHLNPQSGAFYRKVGWKWGRLKLD